MEGSQGGGDGWQEAGLVGMFHASGLHCLCDNGEAVVSGFEGTGKELGEKEGETGRHG